MIFGKIIPLAPSNVSYFILMHYFRNPSCLDNHSLSESLDTEDLTEGCFHSFAL